MLPQVIPVRPVAWLKALMVLFIVLLAMLFSGCIDAPGDGVKVITVGAADYYGHVAKFSGSGPLRDGRIKPDVLAPGVSVISTAPTGLSQLSYVDTFYAKDSGTSLATPVAAGVAALLLQKDPQATPAGIKAALMGGGRKLSNTLGENYEPYYQGAGLIDANRSYNILRSDICGVTPDRWIVGRWAFSPDSSYPGIDVGADKKQKRIYAMAPGDDEWTTKFLFFTNCDRENVSIKVLGDVAGWITVMYLPRAIFANEQIIFGATLVVPNETVSGIYKGSIAILEDGHEIASVPVRVEVARPLAVILGSKVVNETIRKNQWHYYHLNVPVGTRNLTALLSWPGSSNLDVFLLDPSGKCYVNERSRRSEAISLIDPISGRYLMAVHARSISSLENYTLKIEESVIDLKPSSLNFASITPGESKTAEIKLENGGLSLDDLSFIANMENKSTMRLNGEVARDETWERTIAIDANVSRLSINLIWKGKESDLDLDAYEPSGDSAGSSYGDKSTSEFLEIYNPNSGKWKLAVSGYKVPREISQPFDLYVTSYSLDTRPGVKITGPSKVSSGTVGSIAVTVKAPLLAEGQEKRGYIELNSNNYSIRVPLAYTVEGASIKGIAGTTFNDSDQDGHIDFLTIGVAVQAGVPGVYEVRGAVNDCSGRMISWVSNSSRIDRAGVIDLDLDGREIWLRGGCGPLKIGDLLLYNPQGDLVGKYSSSKLIEKVPQDFQAPEVYFNGTFENISETRRGAVSRVALAAGVRVIKSGRYLISASLQREGGTEVASFDRTVDLSEGNHTVVLEFNAKKFGNLADGTRLFLRELTLTAEEDTIDEIKEAWASGEMNFGG